jgi:hypothetical protein
MNKKFYDPIIADLEKIFKENRDSSIHRSKMEYIGERLNQCLDIYARKYGDPKRKYFKELKLRSASAFSNKPYYSDLLYFIDKYCREIIEKPKYKDHSKEQYYVEYKIDGHIEILKCGHTKDQFLKLHSEVGNIVWRVPWYHWPRLKSPLVSFNRWLERKFRINPLKPRGIIILSSLSGLFGAILYELIKMLYKILAK